MLVRDSVGRAQRRSPRRSRRPSRHIRQDGLVHAIWARRLPAERWRQLPVLLGVSQLRLEGGFRPHLLQHRPIQQVDHAVPRGGDRLAVLEPCHVGDWRRRCRLSVAALPTGSRSSPATTVASAFTRTAVCMLVRDSVGRAQRRSPRRSRRPSRHIRQDGLVHAIWARRLPAERWRQLPVLLGRCRVRLARRVESHKRRRGAFQHVHDDVPRRGNDLELQHCDIMGYWRHRHRVPNTRVAAIASGLITHAVAARSFTAIGAAVQAATAAAGRASG